MDKKSLYLFTALFTIFSIFALNSAQVIKSATTHLVISEVQIAGFNATDEFVEIYNPTSTEVDLAGWRLTRSTSTGTEANLVASMSGTIAAGKHLLVAHPDYLGGVTPDVLYSAASNNIASNGAVNLYSDGGVTLVDRLGFGTGVDFETQSVDNPTASGSAERNPKDEDTDNNFNDFDLRTVSDPQNSQSIVVTSTPSASPSASSSSEPSATATATATPTESALPSVEPSSTPTTVPTATATSTPVVTSTPTSTATATPSSTPSGRVIALFFGTNGRTRECRIEYKTKNFGFFILQIPKIKCEWI